MSLDEYRKKIRKCRNSLRIHHPFKKSLPNEWKDVEAAELLHYIDSLNKVAYTGSVSYEGGTIMGRDPVGDEPVFLNMFDSSLGWKPLFFVGANGLGKTAAIKAWCCREHLLGTRFVSVDCKDASGQHEYISNTAGIDCFSDYGSESARGEYYTLARLLGGDSIRGYQHLWPNFPPHLGREYLFDRCQPFLNIDFSETDTCIDGPNKEFLLDAVMSMLNMFKWALKDKGGYAKSRAGVRRTALILDGIGDFLDHMAIRDAFLGLVSAAREKGIAVVISVENMETSIFPYTEVRELFEESRKFLFLGDPLCRMYCTEHLPIKDRFELGNIEIIRKGSRGVACYAEPAGGDSDKVSLCRIDLLKKSEFVPIENCLPEFLFAENAG